MPESVPAVVTAHSEHPMGSQAFNRSVIVKHVLEYIVRY